MDSLDGSYRFVGRKDTQIKIRGQRIEPGEVEYHLGRLPNVAVSMVTRPDAGCFAGELVTVVQMQHLKGERSKVRDEPVSLAPLQSLPIETVREDLLKTLPSYFILEGHDFAIHDTGIDSIQIISLSMFVRKQYKKKMPVDVLLSSKTTIRGLAHLIDNTEEPSPEGHISSEFISSQAMTVDLRCESEVLTEDLLRNIGGRDVNKNEKPSSPIKNVFLTGANGYLGSAILYQLLETPSIQVYALVRCSVKSRGLQRIVDAALLHGWWHDEYTSRIHVWPGDLTKLSLALGPAELERLHGRTVPRDLNVHTIIHNGAKVHYSSDYETLKAVNVLSTFELLRITAGATHISTLVYISGGEKPNLNASLDHRSDASGYTQTKLVSERLVRNCKDHAALQPTSLRVVKLGYIIGSPRNGIANQSDFLWRLVAGCVEIAAYNRDETGHWLFIADMDRVASSVIRGVFGDDNTREANPSGHVDRVLDGLPCSELWAVVADVYGIAFEVLGHDEWMSRLRDRVSESGDVHLLFPLMDVLERDGGWIGEEAAPGPTATAGVREAVEMNLRQLIGAGFFAGTEDEGGPGR